MSVCSHDNFLLGRYVCRDQGQGHLSESSRSLDQIIGYSVAGSKIPSLMAVEFYLYPTISTALVHSVKPKLTE